MKNPKLTLAATVAVAVLASVSGTEALNAQQDPIQRKVLQKKDLSVQGREGVMAAVEIAPGGAEARHTHPGDLMAYVVEGTLVLEVEGKPTVNLKAGDSLFIEAGKVHQGKNFGRTPTKLIAAFFVEKGKPLTSQVK